MSEMERIKAVRLRLPEEISSMKFRNEKYDCDDDLEEYLDRPEFEDIIGWKKVGKFKYSYGASLTRDENGKFKSIHEYYIDFILDSESDNTGEFVKSRELTQNELNKYIPKFIDFFCQVKLSYVKPEVSKDTLRVVEFGYYNGCDAPCCFDTTTDPFYDEV